MSTPRSFGQMPREGFMRTGQLLESLPISRVTLWRWVQAGKLPAPRRIGRTNLWPVQMVRKLMDAPLGEICGESAQAAMQIGSIPACILTNGAGHAGLNNM